MTITMLVANTVRSAERASQGLHAQEASIEPVFEQIE